MHEVWELLLSSLGAWRLAHLIAQEDGPFDAIVALRRAAGTGMLGRLMDCPYCLSLWTAAPFAVCRAQGWGRGFGLWLAISGAVCLIQRWFEARAAPS